MADALNERVGQVVQTTRITIGAVMAGLLTFLGIVVAVIAPEHDPEMPFPLVGLGIAAAAPVASAVVMRAVARAARARVAAAASQEGKASHAVASDDLVGAYLSRQIVGVMILDGAGFVNLIFYAFFGGSYLSLVAAGAMIAALMVLFPTRDGAIRWLERQRDEVEQLRQLPR